MGSGQLRIHTYIHIHTFYCLYYCNKLDTFIEEWLLWLINFYGLNLWNSTNLEIQKGFFPCCFSIIKSSCNVNKEAKSSPYANQNKYDRNQRQSFLCFQSTFLWLCSCKLLLVMKNLENKKGKQDFKPSILGIDSLFSLHKKRCLNNLESEIYGMISIIYRYYWHLVYSYWQLACTLLWFYFSI